MKKETVKIVRGSEDERTAAALGCGILEASRGRRVIMIQLCRDVFAGAAGYLKCLEPGFRIFSFARAGEEAADWENGLNFARKVITTGECDLLILDGFLDLPPVCGANVEGTEAFTFLRQEETELLLTGEGAASDLTQVKEPVSTDTGKGTGSD